MSIGTVILLLFLLFTACCFYKYICAFFGTILLFLAVSLLIIAGVKVDFNKIIKK